MIVVKLIIMEKTFVQKCNTIEDTKTLAEKFAKLVSAQGAFVNLYGEIGAGKTAFGGRRNFEASAVCRPQSQNEINRCT